MELLILCGGGMGQAAYDTACTMGCFSKIEILDDVRPDVMGNLDQLERWKGRFRCAYPAHGDPAVRAALYRRAGLLGYHFPPLVHSSAWVSPTVRVGEAAYIGPQSCVNTGAVIGKGCIVNSGAVVEHHSRCGAFSHIAPGATVLGGARVGDNTLVGAGAIVMNGITIGKNVRLGAGAVAVKDIPDDRTAAGVPAKLLT